MDKANHITTDQAELDLDVLIRAAEIRRDKARMAAVRESAKERLAKYAAVSVCPEDS